MKLTPWQIAKIRAKEASKPDALKRDPNVNYYEGWFFVTLNTRDEVPVLSVCTGDPNIGDGMDGAPRCLYTEVGKGVLAAWKKMAEVCKTVELDLCEVMPGHFHGLVHLLPNNRRHLGSLISGFMSGSDKERDIKTQLMVEGLPFIEIMDNGFSDRYKGVGKAFYALAENRLCQITPWTYVYQKKAPLVPGQKAVSDISREMCMVMNELARVICGREDDWWKSY